MLTTGKELGQEVDVKVGEHLLLIVSALYVMSN